MRTIRIRIYSKLNGRQDFAGPEANRAELQRQADQAVAAYNAAGIEAHLVGEF